MATNHPQPNLFGYQSPPAKTFWLPITPGQTYLATNHPQPKHFGHQSPSAFLATNHPQPKLFGYQSPPAKPIWLPITPSQKSWPSITPSHNILATNHPQRSHFGYQSAPAKPFWLPITPSQNHLATPHAPAAKGPANSSKLVAFCGSSYKQCLKSAAYTGSALVYTMRALLMKVVAKPLAVQRAEILRMFIHTCAYVSYGAAASHQAVKPLWQARSVMMR